MNPWVILAILAALAGLGSWGTYENGRADKWEGKYDSLQSSYTQAAQKAKDDALAQEAKDTALNKQRADNAIKQAQTQANQAQQELKDYQKKLAAAASVKDEGHRCAGVVIPKDLVPK